MKKKLSFVLVIAVFLLVNLIFNFGLWKELFVSKISVSDNIITEFILENSYRNILQFKNPFITDSIFYPFKTNYALNDPANSYTIFFLFLRPFLDPHKIMILIVLLSFFLNNLLMYLLLRKLNISLYLSLVLSLSFGFTPFLSHRIQGHWTYISIYFFPLAYLIVNKFLESKKTKNKIWTSIFFGIFMGFVLLSNFYYFFIILLGVFFYLTYYFFQSRNKLSEFFKKNIIYLLLSVIVSIIFLTPWLVSVISLVRNQEIEQSSGFGGAVDLSADVLSFITPSEYNPLYKKLFAFLSSKISYFYKYNDFFLNSWNRFAYPGLIIILSYFATFFLRSKKNFLNSVWQKIKPHFLISLVFAVLMLGPFLKIANRWFVDLDGVSVLFPLPFLLFHYLPGFSTIRATSRFTPAFAFLAIIVSAYVIDYFLRRIDRKSKVILLSFLFLVFLLDQIYTIPSETKQKIPEKIYIELKSRSQGTVLEIPFTVRDGFRYVGFVHAIQPMFGQIVHGKPIIGGYVARVPDEVFDYYQNLKFIGYLSKIVDKGNYIPMKEWPKEPIVYRYPYPQVTIKKELANLNIKYIILKNNEKYSLLIKELIKNIGFSISQVEGQYELYEK